MGEQDPFYSMGKTLKYVYQGFYIGAITGGLGSCIVTEDSDFLLATAAGGLVGVILGICARALNKD